MKKLFLLIFIAISFSASAQSYQLNVTFTADSWGLMSALYVSKGDSAGARFERKLRIAVQANLPISSWSQNITVDTVPNAVIKWIYSTYKALPNGLISLYDTTIPTVINAMTNSEIVAHRNYINSIYSNQRVNDIRPEATRKNINQ